jgi:hypothetical protein
VFGLVAPALAKDAVKFDPKHYNVEFGVELGGKPAPPN